MTPEQLAERVLCWYAAHGRDLPWRHTRDPYAILVSEVMLQQTQVERVIERWTAWLERWPTAAAPAAAPRAEVIAARQGLGYNRRAVALHEAAGLLADCGTRLPFIERVVFSREKESIPYWNKFLQGYYDASGVSSDNFDQAVQMGGEAEPTEIAGEPPPGQVPAPLEAA